MTVYSDEMFTHIYLVLPVMVVLASFLLAEVVGRQVDPACQKLHRHEGASKGTRRERVSL